MVIVSAQPKKKILATLVFDEHCKFFDDRNNKISGVGLTSVPRNTKVTHIEWNNDGKKLAIACDDGSLLVYNFDSKEPIALNSEYAANAKDQGHTDMINQLAWHPTNDSVATASTDKSIKVFDVRSKTRIYDLSTKSINYCVEWSADGRYLFFADRECKIYSLDTGNWEIGCTVDIKQDENEPEDIYSLQAFADTRHLLVSTSSGKVHVYRTIDGIMTPRVSVTAHSSGQSCYEARLSRDCTRFATGGSDSLSTIWETESLTCSYVYDNMPTAVRSVSWNYNNELVALMCDTYDIHVFYAPDGRCVHKLQLSNVTVSNVAWHPKHNLLTFAMKSNEERDRDTPYIIKFWGGVNGS